MRRALYVALGALLIAPTAGVAAALTIPSGDGTIHACYQKSDGALRVVNEGTACRKSELPLQWSQQGPAGSTAWYTDHWLGDPAITVNAAPPPTYNPGVLMSLDMGTPPPAGGAYLLTASFTLVNGSGGTASPNDAGIGCQLGESQGGRGDFVVPFMGLSPGLQLQGNMYTSNRRTFSLTGVTNLSSVVLSCQEYDWVGSGLATPTPAPQVQFVEGQLTATLAGVATYQPPPRP